MYIYIYIINKRQRKREQKLGGGVYREKRADIIL
jgi:hypothetical protein